MRPSWSPKLRSLRVLGEAVSGRSVSSRRSRGAHAIKGKGASFSSQEFLGQDLSPRAQSQGRGHTGEDGTAALNTSLPEGSLWQLHCCP